MYSKDSPGCFTWAVLPGRSYPPGVAPHTHTFEILEGQGVIVQDNFPFAYKKGDVFKIEGGDSYGFVRIDSYTVVWRGPSETMPGHPHS
jgi:hypothetical protein